MRNWMTLVMILVFSSSAQARSHQHDKQEKKKIVTIEVGDEDRFDERDYDRFLKDKNFDHKAYKYANRRLLRRVRQLELAVKQLQDELYDNKYASPNYTCVIDAGWKGVYIGKASTKIEAKALAFKKCNRKNNSMWCEKPTNCEQDYAMR